jgi:uncharacterized repeat protein (TIGR03803 family)
MKLRRRPRLLFVTLAAMVLVVSLLASAHAQTETILYNFAGLSAGANPTTGLISDSQGNFYGVTLNDGANGCGVVYEVSPYYSGWLETPLYAFSCGSNDGAFPSNLVMDSAGNLYGATEFGGNVTACPDGCGIIYELSPSASGWTETVLYSFNGSDGLAPNSLIRDAAGNFYGTTGLGGEWNSGTVFELSPSENGWIETVLYSFTDGGDGSYPNSLVLDPEGNLYGTAEAGGDFDTYCPFGCGVVFKLTSHRWGWLEKVLYSFSGASDGAHPNGVILDAAGRLYGTTYEGGSCSSDSQGCGVVFRIIGGIFGWRQSVIHTFSGLDGSNPMANVVEDASGNLYGTTIYGGNMNFKCADGGCGVVFKLSPTVHGGWIPSLVYSFYGPHGSFPWAPVIVDGAGNLYGTAVLGGLYGDGVVFRIQP